MEKGQRVQGIRVVAGLLVISNLLVLVFHYILPHFFQQQIFEAFIPFISTLAVFPFDFYQSYLVQQWGAQVGWILVILLCAWGILIHKQWARMTLIVLGIIHCIILAFIVIMKLNQWYVIMLQYCFRLYFNLVAIGSYIGFLTMYEVRSQFVSDPFFDKVNFLFRKLFWRNTPIASARGYYNLGLAYRRLERFSDALHFLGRAVAEEPRNAHFHFELGQTHFLLRHWQEAVESFQKAAACDVVFLPAYIFLGRAFLNQGCAQEAVAAFLKASHVRNEDGEIYYYLGVAYQQGANMTEAEDAFREAVQKGFQSVDNYYRLGQVLFHHLEKYHEAESALLKAVQVDKNHTEAHFLLGLTAIKLLKYKEAIRSFKNTLSLSPEHNQAHYQLGFSYAMIEDFDSARREYSYLLSADKDLAETLKLVLK